jgi:hypothetical protein
LFQTYRSLGLSRAGARHAQARQARIDQPAANTSLTASLRRHKQPTPLPTDEPRTSPVALKLCYGFCAASSEPLSTYTPRSLLVSVPSPLSPPHDRRRFQASYLAVRCLRSQTRSSLHTSHKSRVAKRPVSHRTAHAHNVRRSMVVPVGGVDKRRQSLPPGLLHDYVQRS